MTQPVIRLEITRKQLKVMADALGASLSEGQAYDSDLARELNALLDIHAPGYPHVYILDEERTP